jgi:hypothetical protein
MTFLAPDRLAVARYGRPEPLSRSHPDLRHSVRELAFPRRLFLPNFYPRFEPDFDLGRTKITVAMPDLGISQANVQRTTIGRSIHNFWASYQVGVT